MSRSTAGRWGTAITIGSLVLAAAACGSESDDTPGGTAGAGATAGAGGTAGTGGTAGAGGTAGTGGAQGGGGATGGAGGHGYEVLFASGFEPDSALSGDLLQIVGTDQSTGDAWEELPDLYPPVSYTEFGYVTGGSPDPDYQLPEIIEAEGPHGTTSHVLQLQNIGDSPSGGTSRTEYHLFFEDAPNDYQEGFARFWMKLPANFPQIVSGAPHWYMIMEWKEKSSGNTMTEAECQSTFGSGYYAGGSQNYRINIGIEKEQEDHYYWVIRGEQVQPCRHREWTVRKVGVPIPYGEWFLVEAYMRKHPTDGRVYFAVDGEVIVDGVGRTQHEDSPLDLLFWSIMKIYHGDSWYDQGPTLQWYDDLEILAGEPPAAADQLTIP